SEEVCLPHAWIGGVRLPHAL
ncbi:hypothetical protein Tco_1411399, partial [Tanacetum coccineum]